MKKLLQAWLLISALIWTPFVDAALIGTSGAASIQSELFGGKPYFCNSSNVGSCFVALAANSSVTAYSFTNGSAFLTGSSGAAPTWSSIYCQAQYCTAVAGYLIGSITTTTVGGFSNNYGKSFSPTTLPSSQTWSSVSCSGANCYAVAFSDTTAGAMSSNYGQTWTAMTLPSSQLWTSISCSGLYCAAVSGSGLLSNVAGYLVISTGIWSTVTLPYTANWSSISCTSGYCMAVITTTSTTNQYAYSSTAGLTYTGETFGSSAKWNSVSCAASGYCVAVGSGTAAQSGNYGSTNSAITSGPAATEVSCIGATALTTYCAAVISGSSSGSYYTNNGFGMIYSSAPALPGSLSWNAISHN